MVRQKLLKSIQYLTIYSKHKRGMQ